MAVIKNIYLGAEYKVITRHPEMEKPTEFPNLYETNEYWHLMCSTFFVDIYIWKGSEEGSKFRSWLEEEERKSYDLNSEAMRIALPYLTVEDIINILDFEHELGRIEGLTDAKEVIETILEPFNTENC